MAWWMAIPAVLSAAGSISQYMSGSAQNKTQSQWNQYNAGMQYRTDMANAKTGLALAGLNASLAAKTASLNAAMLRRTAQTQVQASSNVAVYNMGVTKATAMYNDSLLEKDLTNLWDAMDLDLELLENQRAVERGQIEASQAASGTVMGMDSNADVVIDQMTQEALDTVIVKHNADRQASQIQDARAKGMWEARMQVNQIGFEGRMNNIVTLANSEMQAVGTLAQGGMQAAAIMGQGNIEYFAGKYNAQQRLSSGVHGADMQYNMNRTQLSGNLISGLFGAAAQGTSAYFGGKTPNVQTAPKSSLSTPGGSLMNG